MAVLAVIQRIVGWLRAGYPTGVPDHDYVPLFALLRARCSEDELRAAVAESPELRRGEDPDTVLSSVISRLSSSPPSPEDVERVRAHLSLVGWEDPQGS